MIIVLGTPHLSTQLTPGVQGRSPWAAMSMKLRLKSAHSSAGRKPSCHDWQPSDCSRTRARLSVIGSLLSAGACVLLATYKVGGCAGRLRAWGVGSRVGRRVGGGAGGCVSGRVAPRRRGRVGAIFGWRVRARCRGRVGAIFGWGMSRRVGRQRSGRFGWRVGGRVGGGVSWCVCGHVRGCACGDIGCSGGIG